MLDEVKKKRFKRKIFLLSLTVFKAFSKAQRATDILKKRKFFSIKIFQSIFF
jgi:hypothetical protein